MIEKTFLINKIKRTFDNVVIYNSEQSIQELNDKFGLSKKLCDNSLIFKIDYSELNKHYELKYRGGSSINPVNQHELVVEYVCLPDKPKLYHNGIFIQTVDNIANIEHNDLENCLIYIGDDVYKLKHENGKIVLTYNN